MWGYWNGIDETFGKDYDYYPAMDDKNNKIGLIGNPEKFYKDFYSFLSDAGIDFVKVDNQGSFQDIMIKDKISIWDSYRKAMVKNAEEFLQGNVVHSMAFTPHILLNLILPQSHKSIFRYLKKKKYYNNIGLTCVIGIAMIFFPMKMKVIRGIFMQMPLILYGKHLPLLVIGICFSHIIYLPSIMQQGIK